MQRKIVVELSDDEVIVLFEFLSRFSNDNDLRILDKSEEIVLWNIQAELETLLSAHLDSDYKTIVAKARERINGCVDER